MANKRGPLNTAEKFYIEGNCLKKTPETIAAKLDRTVKSVEKHIEVLKKAKPEMFDIDTSLAGPAFARDSKKRTVSATSASTELMDEIRKQTDYKKMRGYRESVIDPRGN